MDTIKSGNYQKEESHSKNDSTFVKIPRGISAPNYTQTPNELFDEWLPHLGYAELKVLLVIIRKTFGWHKKRDKISLSQLMDLTGIKKRTSILDATEFLVKNGLITKEVIGETGTEETYYELCIFDDSNNSYQSPKVTGGSDLKGLGGSNLKSPTKETLSKEKKKEREKEIYKEKKGVVAPLDPSPSASPPPSFFTYKSKESEETREISQSSWDKLIIQHGQAKVETVLERIINYELGKGKKMYKDYCATIRNWIVDSPSGQKSAEIDKVEWAIKNKRLVEEIAEKFPHLAVYMNISKETYLTFPMRGKDLSYNMEPKAFWSSLRTTLMSISEGKEEKSYNTWSE